MGAPRMDDVTTNSPAYMAGLLERARGGDRAALDELFAASRNLIAIVAPAQLESWLQAKVDASDLVQQTLLEAHRGFAGFQGQTEGEWIAWLRRILTHNAADLVRHYRGVDKRSIQRERALEVQHAQDGEMWTREPADPGESPSQYLMREESQLQIANALAALTDDHREVITLRNLQRLPFDVIAERMNRSRPAVQMLWMRALAKLREAMDSP